MNVPLAIFEPEYPNRLHPLSLLSLIYDLRYGFKPFSFYLKREFGQPQFFVVPKRFHPLIESRFGKGFLSPEGEVLVINSSVRPSNYDVIKKLGSNQAIFEGEELVAARGKLPDALDRQNMRHAGFEILEGRDLLVEGPWELIEALKNGLEGRGIVYGSNVRMEEPVYFDMSEGPIFIADGVRLEAFTRIAGPAYIGRNSIIHSARINPYTFIGEVCRVGGEVEFSIVESYSNKTHYGYLGHSYIASFVNLGAGTTTSDLKNTYGTVRVNHLGKRVDTGLRKLGAFIAHHAKTAINTSIFSGKKLGAFSHAYNTVKEDVPPFTISGLYEDYRELFLESAIETAKRMKRRRGLELTKEEEYLIKDSFALSKGERPWSEYST